MKFNWKKLLSLFLPILVSIAVEAVETQLGGEDPETTATPDKPLAQPKIAVREITNEIPWFQSQN